PTRPSCAARRCCNSATRPPRWRRSPRYPTTSPTRPGPAGTGCGCSGCSPATRPRPWPPPPTSNASAAPHTPGCGPPSPPPGRPDPPCPALARGYASAAASLAEADGGLLASARGRLQRLPRAPASAQALIDWVAREAAWLDGQPERATAGTGTDTGLPLVDGLRRITARWAAYDSGILAAHEGR